LNLFTVGIIIIIGEGGEKSACGVVEEFSKDHYVSDDILFLLYFVLFSVVECSEFRFFSSSAFNNIIIVVHFFIAAANLMASINRAKESVLLHRSQSSGCKFIVVSFFFSFRWHARHLPPNDGVIVSQQDSDSSSFGA
jgi:hypothetical protein